MACILRAVLSTGFLWQCRPVSIEGCRRRILCRFGSSASASCAGSPSRWLNHTFACAAHRCLLDGIPGLRLPGSAVSPRFRPLRTSRRPGGYAVTPAPGGRDLHPHGELSYEVRIHLAVCPEVHSSCYVNLQEKKKTLPLSGTCEQSIAPPDGSSPSTLSRLLYITL